MSGFYELIGRAVVEFVRRRYGREIQFAGALALGAVLLGIGAWAAGRDDESA